LNFKINLLGIKYSSKVPVQYRYAYIVLELNYMFYNPINVGFDRTMVRSPVHIMNRRCTSWIWSWLCRAKATVFLCFCCSCFVLSLCYDCIVL